MTRFVLTIASLAVAAGTLSAAAAAADCRSEVEATFEKQRTNAPGYRVATEQFQDNGKIAISIDYQLPDRMHQKVVAPGERAPIETIAVAKWAWGNMGGGWEELQPQFSQSVTAHVHDTLAEPVKASGNFECLGKTTFEGKEYSAYRSVAAPEGKVANVGGKSAPDIRRTIYVDPASGLPALNIVSEASGSGKVWARTAFSYPKDLVVDAPVGAAPAPRTR